VTKLVVPPSTEIHFVLPLLSQGSQPTHSLPSIILSDRDRPVAVQHIDVSLGESVVAVVEATATGD
jgi:hypothetical protein